MIDQIIQVSGSVMILAAFSLLQLRKTTVSSWTYLLLNAIGATILAINATLNQAWGFTLLEVVWAIVSFVAIGRLLQRNRKRLTRARH